MFQGTLLLYSMSSQSKLLNLYLTNPAAEDNITWTIFLSVWGKNVFQGIEKTKRIKYW